MVVVVQQNLNAERDFDSLLPIQDYSANKTDVSQSIGQVSAINWKLEIHWLRAQ
jgi:hypothetical protein